MAPIVACLIVYTGAASSDPRRSGMEVTSFGVGFFRYLLLALLASGIVSTIVELIARGDGGKVTYALSFIAAFVFVFLAYHWDVIGVWTPEELIR